jgi:hypothetical protein
MVGVVLPDSTMTIPAGASSAAKAEYRREKVINRLRDSSSGDRTLTLCLPLLVMFVWSKALNVEQPIGAFSLS